MFAMQFGRKKLYAAALADRSVDRHRLDKLLRHLSPYVPPMVRFDLVISRRGSLGDKTVLQAMRLGRRYRVALRIADSMASDYRPGASKQVQRASFVRTHALEAEHGRRVMLDDVANGFNDVLAGRVQTADELRVSVRRPRPH